jgi:hypothetical protein
MCASTCTGHITLREPNIQRKTPAPDWGEHRIGQGGSRAWPRDFARLIADGIASYQFISTAMKHFYPPAVLGKMVAQDGKTASVFRARTGGRFFPFPASGAEKGRSLCRAGRSRRRPRSAPDLSWQNQDWL